MKKKVVSIFLGFMCMCNLVACGAKADPNITEADRPAHASSSSSSRHDDSSRDNDEEDDDKPAEDDNKPNENFIRDEEISSTSELGEGNDFNETARMVDYLGASGKNTIVSQTSLNYALCLLLEGADGTTKDQIYTYLNNCYLADAGLSYSNRCNEMMNAYMNNEGYTLNLANSVWADDEITLEDDYVSTIEQYYDGTASVLDLQSAGAADPINDWCSDKTNGLIDSIVTDSMLYPCRNVIVNALYFNGKWEDPYEGNQIREEEFTNVNGEVSTMDMLHSTEGVYYENEYATAYSKAYEGYDIIFVGILPKLDEGESAGDFSLEELDINSLMASRTYEYDVISVVPKFVVEDSNSLTDYMGNSGLDDLFSDTADFSSMCSESALMVSEVIQKTYVDVNESGTEAAAVTAVMMTDACVAIDEPREIKEVRLDRPFAFMIYDTTNDEVLFMGKVLDL